MKIRIKSWKLRSKMPEEQEKVEVTLKDAYECKDVELSKNYMTSATAISIFSTSLIQDINEKKWKLFSKFKEFTAEDFSKSCCSIMTPLDFLSSHKLKKVTRKIMKTVIRKRKVYAPFLISNDALDWSGKSPRFEKSILMEQYKVESFSQPSAYWASAYKACQKNSSEFSFFKKAIDKFEN